MSADAAASTPQAPAPDLAIRARPPSPVRLSRKVLIGGALVAGAVVALALVTGLSERERRSADAESHVSAATGVPETISGANDQYGAGDLALPADAPLTDDTGAELQLPPEHRGGAPQASRQADARDDAPSALETARAASILFDRTRAASGAPEGDRLIAPVSRYEIKAGDTIQAALVTALNSDLQGMVIAQVTSPVFDSVTGQHLLIPQGARIIGAYRANAAYGDRRLLLTWERLILPNGWSLNLGSMVGADGSGASGLSDRTDNHLDRVAVAVGLSSILSVVANEADDSEERDGFGPNVADAAAQQAASSGGRIVDRELTVRPTLRVRAGAPVRVLVTRDLVLAPYRASSTR